MRLSNVSQTEIASVMTWLRQSDGKGPVTASDVNHIRIVTAAHNTFWTQDDLRNFQAR